MDPLTNLKHEYYSVELHGHAAEAAANGFGHRQCSRRVDILNRGQQPEVMERIRPFWDDDKIAALDAVADAMRENLLRQDALKGESQQATRDLAATTKQLRGWYASFSRIARAALKDKPDLLEKIGIFARSAPRRKAAPANDPTS